MKRLLIVLTLICSLSLSVFAGHTQLGGGRWCECDPVEGVCLCCGGSFPIAINDQESESGSVNQNASDASEPAFELGLVLLALLVWLKLKA
jgi:hypothetical protein